MNRAQLKVRWPFPTALILATTVFALDADAVTYGNGIVRVLVAGVYQPTRISEIDFNSNFTAVIDGGRLVVTGSGGGGVADGSVDQTKLSASLMAEIPFLNDAGVIPGYIQGTTAYTTLGYSDGGLDDGGTNTVAYGRLLVDPTNFYLHADSVDAATVLDLRTNGGGQAVGTSRTITGVNGGVVGNGGLFSLAQNLLVGPSLFDNIITGTADTTDATNTRCVAFALPDGMQAMVFFFEEATNADGGSQALTGSYVRYGEFVHSDGAVPYIHLAAYKNVVTDTEDNAGWGGAGPATFDGGGGAGAFVEVRTVGAASTTIHHECILAVIYFPKASFDAGIK